MKKSLGVEPGDFLIGFLWLLCYEFQGLVAALCDVESLLDSLQLQGRLAGGVARSAHQVAVHVEKHNLAGAVECVAFAVEFNMCVSDHVQCRRGR